MLIAMIRRAAGLTLLPCAAVFRGALVVLAAMGLGWLMKAAAEGGFFE